MILITANMADPNAIEPAWMTNPLKNDLLET